MRNPASEGDQHIDNRTSLAICGAIGERLRRDTAPVSDVLPTQLQTLITEMERREGGHGQR